MEQTWHAGLFTRRFGPSPHEDVPAVVLVHGLGLSGRYFVPLARRLAAGGASVLVPDLPGNAWSRSAARRAPDVEGVADALARWHRRLALPPCLFVGNSVGCQVIAAFAARHPHLVRGAVLVGPALDPDASGWRQAGRLLVDAPREPLSLLAVATADYLLTGPVRFAASFRHALRDAAGQFEAHLARMRVPTLVVRGTGDPVASGDWVRRVARTVADGRVAEVRGAAHAAHYSAPDTVAALIRAFAPKEREEREAASEGRG
ncbi:alpha/beta hydrolase [Streptomyces somaliensis DSM 40738]|uniref:alpha/beta fold hydrolase n=1 Tax=Streptomyces somaliensis TaxID=78355 RepID=UPI0021C3688F|nr:alpha/beta hydrolase [Streptomyces somaliensis]MCQ0025534.1 alpha/beta hydrolase [Streptomyces somaliensis DSM 40738]